MNRIEVSLEGILLILMLSLIVSPVAAVTFGTEDRDSHPYVGLVVFYNNTGAPMWRCSGTLISPTVFLTAGHCTNGTTTAKVWFEPNLTIYPNTGVAGIPYTHPNFNGFATFPNIHDVGVVVLNEEVIKETYGILPELNILDKLAEKRGQQEQTFTVVGYGFQSIKPFFEAKRIRYNATTTLINLRNALTDGYNIQLTNNPGKYEGGGTCFGDSGGPVLKDDTNIIVAVTSFGLNTLCKGTDFGFRIDTVDAQNFIESYLDAN